MQNLLCSLREASLSFCCCYWSEDLLGSLGVHADLPFYIDLAREELIDFTRVYWEDERHACGGLVLHYLGCGGKLWIRRKGFVSLKHQRREDLIFPGWRESKIETVRERSTFSYCKYAIERKTIN